MEEHLRRIANKHWIYTNKRLLRLPQESRIQLVEMAGEVADMEEYLIWSR